jgi:hypothetical protein
VRRWRLKVGIRCFGRFSSVDLSPAHSTPHVGDRSDVLPGAHADSDDKTVVEGILLLELPGTRLRVRHLLTRLLAGGEVPVLLKVFSGIE